MPPAAKATWNVMVCVGKVCAETGCARPMALATSNRQRMVRKADSASGIIPVFPRPGSVRLHDRLKPRPGLGALPPHQIKVLGVLPLDDGVIKTRPRFATAVPVRDMISLTDHTEDVEMFEAREVGGKGDIRQGVGVAGEPSVRSEGFFHLVEEESHALDCNNEVLRLRS